MPPKRFAFIFPPFANDYPDDPFGSLKGFDAIFSRFLDQAAIIADPELRHFNIRSRNFLDDELRTQYIAYIQGCALSDFFSRKNLVPAYSAGYSMGIYTALFQAGAISFEEGMDLIRFAFEEIKKSIGHLAFTMGSVIGLDREDLLRMIHQSDMQTEITIQNSTCSFILSGYQSDIRRILDDAKTEGALSARELQVTVPYHSRFLMEAAMNFEKKVMKMDFRRADIPIISLIDQGTLREEYSMKEEVVRNLFLPLNWNKTQAYLQQVGINTFVECGPNKALVKNSKFVPGDALFLPADLSPILKSL